MGSSSKHAVQVKTAIFGGTGGTAAGFLSRWVLRDAEELLLVSSALDENGFRGPIKASTRGDLGFGGEKGSSGEVDLTKDERADWAGCRNGSTVSGERHSAGEEETIVDDATCGRI